MKRFEFSLDRLLRVKRQLERLAELEQRRALGAAEQARATLEGLREQQLGDQANGGQHSTTRRGDGIRSSEEPKPAAIR